MSTTSGFFNASTTPDNTHEVESFVSTIVAGAGVAQVVNPTQPEQSATVFNYSANWVRGIVTFTTGVTALGGAATRAFLVPPNGTFNLDFSSENDAASAAGVLGSIDSISLAPVAMPVAAGVVEASTLGLAAAASAGYVAVNFATA